MPDRLSELPENLSDFQTGRIGLQELIHAWRDAAEAHQPALPHRYRDVLERLLNQLESSALFTEESCSFSQVDMVGALGDWLAKARALAAQP
jgi:hypothetical protein